MFEIVDAEISFRSQRLAMPLCLSSGTIEELTQATASITGECFGQRATGRGTVFLSDVWAWPEDGLSHDERDRALRQLCESMAAGLVEYFRGQKLHPLEAGLQLHHWVSNELAMEPSPPALARAMCASPFDAAIHDAAGLALGQSAFALYREVVTFPSVDNYFPDGGACRAIAGIIGKPRRELAAWYVVGMTEPLESTMVPAIKRHSYRHFKLKLTGRDNELDVARTIEVYRAATSSGVPEVRLTVDTNEANPSAESVADYLDRLREADRAAFDALAYLEQPTHRDIRKHAFDWRPVTRYKPVMLDEGLIDLDVLPDAQRQGYSGLALKTCKGHSMLLVCAGWAHQHGMSISLQDLTNPGIALIHAALVGVHLPTINGAELNSPQFTPGANTEIAAGLPELFGPQNGVHRLPPKVPAGLGSML
jgi:L-alanine-DL-glutamate epimerase-like enolase superfamily enzyme